jgi:hypothetical protein
VDAEPDPVVPGLGGADLVAFMKTTRRNGLRGDRASMIPRM